MIKLFYWFKYTNWFILISTSQYFLACNFFFNPSLHCTKISSYDLCKPVTYIKWVNVKDSMDIRSEIARDVTNTNNTH